MNAVRLVVLVVEQGSSIPDAKDFVSNHAYPFIFLLKALSAKYMKECWNKILSKMGFMPQDWNKC
jgi:hypothetical protein